MAKSKILNAFYKYIVSYITIIITTTKALA
jgi:hypothetical protein